MNKTKVGTLGSPVNGEKKIVLKNVYSFQIWLLIEL